jgi:predicted type IV restriction endonuclease
MASIPSKVASRIAAGLKRFQPILDSARARDANESDTVILVMDLLHEVFGYDKYAEITSEHAIRGTFCDLAIKVDGALSLLIEVKAIGLDLKDQHVKQAIDYAANQGCEWVALTNGVVWRAYRVAFTKPINQELVVEFDLAGVNPRKEADLELVWLLCKEGWQKARLGEYHEQRQALSRFTFGAVLLSEPLVDVLRRELRRVSPEAKIEERQIRDVLVTEVLRREVFEGEKADAAKRLVARAAHRTLRSTKKEMDQATVPTPDPKPAASR